MKVLSKIKESFKEDPDSYYVPIGVISFFLLAILVPYFLFSNSEYSKEISCTLHVGEIDCSANFPASWVNKITFNYRTPLSDESKNKIVESKTVFYGSKVNN